jgi:hypothetical protein
MTNPYARAAMNVISLFMTLVGCWKMGRLYLRSRREAGFDWRKGREPIIALVWVWAALAIHLIFGVA